LRKEEVGKAAGRREKERKNEKEEEEAMDKTK
jgi:hypothetical protein